jgi:hypothetical protein
MASPETRHQEHSLLAFAREHRWEIIFGLAFAVLFGLWWEEFKVVRERADRITPERQALGTVRVLTVIDRVCPAQRPHEPRQHSRNRRRAHAPRRPGGDAGRLSEALPEVPWCHRYSRSRRPANGNVLPDGTATETDRRDAEPVRGARGTGEPGLFEGRSHGFSAIARLRSSISLCSSSVR